jgi:hypothetical protein
MRCGVWLDAGRAYGLAVWQRHHRDERLAAVAVGDPGDHNEPLMRESPRVNDDTGCVLVAVTDLARHS